jgi:hypothetical protein
MGCDSVAFAMYSNENKAQLSCGFDTDTTKLSGATSAVYPKH